MNSTTPDKSKSPVMMGRMISKSLIFSLITASIAAIGMVRFVAPNTIKSWKQLELDAPSWAIWMTDNATLAMMAVLLITIIGLGNSLFIKQRQVNMAIMFACTLLLSLAVLLGIFTWWTTYIALFEEAGKF